MALENTIFLLLTPFAHHKRAIAENFEMHCHSIQESFQLTNQKSYIPAAVGDSARGERVDGRLGFPQI